MPDKPENVKPGPGHDTSVRGLHDYPPILTVNDAARMLQLSKSTLYKRLAAGQFKRASRRGNPTRLLRDEVIREFFGRR